MGELEASILLDPSNAAPYFLGGVFYELGRLEESRASFQQCVASNPSLPFALNGLGAALMGLGDLRAARWTLERALTVERGAGGWSGAGIGLAECLRRQGKLDEARALCLESVEFTEQGDFHGRRWARTSGLVQLGRIALSQEDLSAAKVAFEQAVSHIKTTPAGLGRGHLMVIALAGLSSAGEGPGFYEEARRIFEARDTYDFSFAFGSSDDWTLMELARAARRLGRAEESEELLQRARRAGSREEL